jgi:zinc protease
MKNSIYRVFSLILFAVIINGSITSCSSDQGSTSGSTDFSIDYEKFTLDNGLSVVLHVDKSDPVVAVALTSHVGSSREIDGRTGFAHLFEHLLFLESENLGKGGLDKLSARIGGSGANGSTSRDRTNYYQTVPKDALEKMIWAEADKLGFFINTVTEPVLAKEKQVVKNEKRQGVDNQPYGHTSYVIDKNLYPAGHPYSWQVIGSLDDLQAATLQDVKDFFNRWYVPNNVTLTIAGDFDPAQAKAWVEKYFGEIPRGGDIPKMEPQPAELSETKRLFYEDNFARLPQLTLTWPSVELYHPDSYALDVLADYLANGKRAPLYKVLVEEKQLTDAVRSSQYSSEIAGQYSIAVTAFSGTQLDSVYAAIDEALARFEADGIAQEDLDRIKAGQETGFYNSLSSVVGKGFQLAQYDIFANDPGFINQDIKNILNVTSDDVMRVYNTYIKGKNSVITSFVPRGQSALALTESTPAQVVEEQIVEGAEDSFDASITVDYERTPSSFDRSVEPPYGESPEVVVPQVWKSSLSSGMRVWGIEHNEVPLVQFQLQIKGGLLLEDANKIGVSNLMAQMMTKGTQNRTPEELETAIESLGASIRVSASDESINISGNTLTRNYDKTMQLVNEILLEPRWDVTEFELLKQSTLSRIIQMKANPNSIASNQFTALVYGEGHILSNNSMGTEESVNAITIDDLKAYYEANLSPTIADFHVVGDIDQSRVMASLTSLNENWSARDVTLPTIQVPNAPDKATIYFYDVPDAKQSVIQIGYPALAVTDADYYPASIMNYRLGGGGFASQLTQELREGKGYTYGIRSGFSGSNIKGPFSISTSVRTNITYEAVSLIRDIVSNYGSTFGDQDLDVTTSYLIKSNARAFETLSAKLGMLSTISNYGFDDDYIKQREQIVNGMTVEEIRRLADQYLDPNRMIYVVVGDAKTQMARLEALGMGKPVPLK